MIKATASLASQISSLRTNVDFSEWGAFIFVFRTSGCPFAEVPVRFPPSLYRVGVGFCNQSECGPLVRTGNTLVRQLVVLLVADHISLMLLLAVANPSIARCCLFLQHLSYLFRHGRANPDYPFFFIPVVVWPGW